MMNCQTFLLSVLLQLFSNGKLNGLLSRRTLLLGKVMISDHINCASCFWHVFIDECPENLSVLLLLSKEQYVTPGELQLQMVIFDYFCLFLIIYSLNTKWAKNH